MEPVRQGVEIYLDGRWVFLEVSDRAAADALQARSQEYIPTRRVIETAEGHVVTVHATE